MVHLDVHVRRFCACISSSQAPQHYNLSCLSSSIYMHAALLRGCCETRSHEDLHLHCGHRCCDTGHCSSTVTRLYVDCIWYREKFSAYSQEEKGGNSGGSSLPNLDRRGIKPPNFWTVYCIACLCIFSSVPLKNHTMECGLHGHWCYNSHKLQHQ